MSCITELLSIKDRPEILSACINNGVIMEGGGIYKDYEYLIVFTSGGHRCGYVAINPDHPLYGKNLDINYMSALEVHGGITFHSGTHHLKQHLEHACIDEWIGFDAMHFRDGPCKITAEKYFGKPCASSSLDGYHKDFDYMESECKSMIDQLAEMKNVYNY